MTNIEQWNELAEWLEAKSVMICELNDCTEDEHNCDSYAYIDADGVCHDICGSDYFGFANTIPVAVIPLPWQGDGVELYGAVMDDLG